MSGAVRLSRVLPLREGAGVRGVRWYVRSRASEYRPYLAFARHKYDGSVIGPETEMVIDVLNPREFSSLLQENPAIARKIYLQAIRRLYEDNQRGLQ